MDADVLEAFLRGTLDPRIHEYWARHLRGCALCQQAVQKHQKLSKLLKLADQPVQPAGGAERVLARIAGAIQPGGGRGRLRRLLLAVAAGVACGVGAGWGVTRATAHTAIDRAEGPLPDPAVVANVDALLVLAKDPWLADSYEAARWFEQLLRPSGEFDGPRP